MDQVELATARVAIISSELKTLEAEWHTQQQQLATEMEQLKTKLSEFKRKQQLLSAKIDPQAVESYHELRKQKGTLNVMRRR